MKNTFILLFISVFLSSCDNDSKVIESEKNVRLSDLIERVSLQIGGLE